MVAISNTYFKHLKLHHKASVFHLLMIEYYNFLSAH
jgi:hypothetical protein